MNIDFYLIIIMLKTILFVTIIMKSSLLKREIVVLKNSVFDGKISIFIGDVHTFLFIFAIEGENIHFLKLFKSHAMNRIFFYYYISIISRSIFIYSSCLLWDAGGVVEKNYFEEYNWIIVFFRFGSFLQPPLQTYILVTRVKSSR